MLPVRRICFPSLGMGLHNRFLTSARRLFMTWICNLTITTRTRNDEWCMRNSAQFAHWQCLMPHAEHRTAIWAATRCRHGSYVIRLKMHRRRWSADGVGDDLCLIGSGSGAFNAIDFSAQGHCMPSIQYLVTVSVSIQVLVQFWPSPT